jgi:holin-like protein
MMLRAYLVLLSCQAAGDCLHQLLRFPLSGSLIGMVILLAVLTLRRGASAEFSQSAQSVLAYLPLFFVPAGVGVMRHLPLLYAHLLPTLVALVASTALAMASGALAMHAVNRIFRLRRGPALFNASVSGELG